jgi:hypothetical protein
MKQVYLKLKDELQNFVEQKLANLCLQQQQSTKSINRTPMSGYQDGSLRRKFLEVYATGNSSCGNYP